MKKLEIYLLEFILLFTIFSRGLFELIDEKLLSFFIQAILIVLSILFLSSKVRISTYQITTYSIILVLSLISILLTSEAVYHYILLIGFIIFLDIFTPHLKVSDKFYFILLINLALSIFIAYLQMTKVTWITNNGISFVLGNYVRPSSLTGSYLHFPLLVFISIVILYQHYKKTASTLFILMLPILSKSFYFLSVVFIFLLALIKSPKTVLYSVISLIIFIQGLHFILDINVLYLFDPDNIGNKQRIGAWASGIAQLAPINLILSTEFGYYSNIANNFGVDFEILESSALHFILNLGFISALLLYIIIFKSNKNSQILGPFLLSFMLYSFLYQALEVLSIITLLFLSKHYIK